MSRKRGSAVLRFFQKLDTSGDCWLWTGARTNTGYGQFRYYGRTVLAHRWVYETCEDDIAPDMVLDHLCKTPLCCRPDHLEQVTNRENVLRGVGFTAANAAKTACPQGHPYSERGNGARYCRTCNRARVAAYRAAKRSAA